MSPHPQDVRTQHWGAPNSRRTNGRGPQWSCAYLSFLSLAGYYLTTWFGALHHIAHYQPEAGRAPQGLSSEARASLRQWHRRRTLHRQDPAGAQVTIHQTAGSTGGLVLLPF